MTILSLRNLTRSLNTRSFRFDRAARGLLGVVSLALGLTVITPSMATAQSQARVCVHVPQGSDYNSGWAPFVLVLRDKSFGPTP